MAIENNIAPELFLSQSVSGLMIDVRTPAEYDAGHIPGAVNIPIFSNEERAVVGTIYKKVSKEKAIEKGLDFVGGKLGDFVRQVRKEYRKRDFSPDTPLFVYCWRGGMRSNSMAWLFATAGFRVRVLKGGYKAFRNTFARKAEENYWKLITIGGPTGSGKTYILQALARMGEQVIDLEGLARHRGSAFGYYGFDQPQPSNEHFANLLYEQLHRLDPSRRIWCECESMSIGRVFIPREFFRLIVEAPMVYLEMPQELRLKHILSDYGDCPKEILTASFEGIAKRLGYDNAKRAMELVESGDLAAAAAIALQYYDKTYAHSMQKNQYPVICHYTAVSDCPERSAAEILTKVNEIENQNEYVEKND